MLPVRTTQCPCCGELIELIIDDTIEHQRYVEDCSVCCRPISVDVFVDDHGEIQLSCSGENEA